MAETIFHARRLLFFVVIFARVTVTNPAAANTSENWDVYPAVYHAMQKDWPFISHVDLAGKSLHIYSASNRNSFYHQWSMKGDGCTHASYSLSIRRGRNQTTLTSREQAIVNAVQIGNIRRDASPEPEIIPNGGSETEMNTPPLERHRPVRERYRDQSLI